MFRWNPRPNPCCRRVRLLAGYYRVLGLPATVRYRYPTMSILPPLRNYSLVASKIAAIVLRRCSCFAGPHNACPEAIRQLEIGAVYSNEYE
jgi:hypothetical protein